MKKNNQAKQWITTGIIIVIIIALITIFSTQKTPKQEETIKIGAILPVTGWGAYWGDPAKKGMLLAAEKINDPNLDLIIEDTQSDNKNAVTAAQKLLDINNVDLILVVFSGASNVVSPIVLDKNKIMIYDSFSPQILDKNPNSFKFYFDPYKEYKKLGEIAIEDGKKNVAVILAQLEFADDIKKALNNLSGLNATYYYFNWDETDFRTILTKVKDQGADAIIAMGYEGNFLNMFKQMEELGINLPVYCGGRYDCLTDKIINSTNVSGYTTFDIVLSNDFKDSFLEKYPSASGTEIMAAASGYDMVLYAYNALKECPNRDTECVREKLLNIKLKSAIKTKEGFRNDRQYDISSVNIRYNGKEKKFELIE